MVGIGRRTGRRSLVLGRAGGGLEDVGREGRLGELWESGKRLENIVSSGFPWYRVTSEAVFFHTETGV